MPTLIKHGQLVSSLSVQYGDLRIDAEKISKIAPEIEPQADDEVIDARDCLVLPGVIDAHTHFDLVSRGGARTIDDFYAGSVSAALGGVTTVIDFAEPVSGKPLGPALEQRLGEAKGSLVDYALHWVVTDQMPLEEVAYLPRYGIKAIKLFTTYRDAGYYLPPGKLARLLNLAKHQGLILTVHAENDAIIAQRTAYWQKKGKLSPSSHPLTHPALAEVKAVKNILKLNQDIGCEVYFVHVSTAEACQAIEEARSQGQQIWGETCPHYLLLNSEYYERPDAKLFIMTPPLRSREDARALWQGLAKGSLQVVATDHCAYSAAQKEQGQTCLDTLPGIPGVETLLPLLYTYGVRPGCLSLQQMVALLAENPARIFGLEHRKGKLAVGIDADVVIWDPSPVNVLRAAHLHTRAGYTPFEGMTVHGSIRTVLRRGHRLAHQGQLSPTSPGQFIPATV